MLEIIVVYNLVKYIGKIADKKTRKPGSWKLAVVVSWILAEVVGVAIGMLLFEGYIYYILGIGLAVASFFIIKAILNSKPDLQDDNWIEQIGQETPVESQL